MTAAAAAEPVARKRGFTQRMVDGVERLGKQGAAVLWTLFFVAWYLLGIPLGPEAPVHA